MKDPTFLGGFPVWALCCGLAGCAAHQGGAPLAHYAPSGSGHSLSARRYDPPGPPEDPWGPYIRAASARFGVSEIWIRAVMRQESGGKQLQDGAPITSPAGAMGLMQVMPDTYDALRARYGFGDDPYYPRDNILAGAAYIRDMYEIYGFPSFLAAYNAGPALLDACLSTGAPLPQETISYLSAVAPRLRDYAMISGPLAGYAQVADGISADELNRLALMGQRPPPTAPSAAPTLACAPPASDRSADALNRTVLDGAGEGPALAGDPSDASADALNRQALAQGAGSIAR